MPVADLEQSTCGPHGQIERRPRHELLVVHVAAVNAGRIARHAPRIARRSDTHAAEEWMQWNHDPVAQRRHHARGVEANDARARIAAILAEKAAAPVVGVGDGEMRVEDAHLEHVAGIGARHVNGSSENVTAGPAVRDGIHHVAQRLLHLGARQSRALQPAGRVGEERLDFNGIARGDAEHRCGRRAVVAVGHGVRCGREVVDVCCRLRGCSGCGGKQNEHEGGE